MNDIYEVFMKVNEIKPIDFLTIYNVLTSAQISDAQKTEFISHNRKQIKNIMLEQINSQEFMTIMETRAIKKFRPLKNSFTKAGDKIILAKALSMPPNMIPQYIKNVTQSLNDIEQLKFLSKDKMDMLKTYIYRHGTKDQIVLFLDYELTNAKDKIKTLYRTLEYHNQGVADYFIRPIHRLDNKTLLKLFKVISKHINQAYENKEISEMQSLKIAKWALVQIYNIQNNSKLLNAIKTYKTLA